MIAHLQGALIQKNPVSIIVDTGGVGYQVFVSLQTFYALPDLGARIALHIHTHVREDEIRLFGFGGELEQKLFEKLIGISKVGPKMAMSILSGLAPRDLIAAIANKDIARLSSIPGVGGKTAERLALEMKDKLKDLAAGEPAQPARTQDALWEDALSALLNLGYKRAAAEQALQTASARGGAPSLERLIKDSLNLLA